MAGILDTEEGINALQRNQQFFEKGVGDTTAGSRLLGTITGTDVSPSKPISAETSYLDPVSRTVYNVVAPYGKLALNIALTAIRLPGAAAADIANMFGVEEKDVNEIQALTNSVIFQSFGQGPRVIGAGSQIKNVAGKIADEAAVTGRYFPEYNPFKQAEPASLSAADTGLSMPTTKIKESSVLADDFLERSAQVKKNIRESKGTIHPQSVKQQKQYDNATQVYKKDDEVVDLLSDYQILAGYKRQPKGVKGTADFDKYFKSQGKDYDTFLKKMHNLLARGDENLIKYLKQNMTYNRTHYKNFRKTLVNRFGDPGRPRDLVVQRTAKYLDDYVNEYKAANEGAVPSGNEFTRERLLKWLLAKNDPEINAFFANKKDQTAAIRKIVESIRKKNLLQEGFNPTTRGAYKLDKITKYVRKGQNIENLSVPTQTQITSFLDDISTNIPKDVRASSKALIKNNLIDRIAKGLIKEADKTGKSLINLEDELLQIMNKVDKKKLGEIYSKRAELQKFVKEATKQEKWATGKWGSIQVSHVKAVADDWRLALDADNMFFATGEANLRQIHINRNIDKVLKDFSVAKTLSDKKKVVQELHAIEQKLVDQGVISEFQGIRRLFGISKDVDTEAELMKKVISQVTSLKDGGLVGISQLTRPLRNFSS